MKNYSVIIPQHDCADLTKRCILSIPEREDIQVIVIDDNSRNVDELRLVETSLNRKNVSFVYTTEGRGAGYARNVGLSKAEGKWLIFSDADDFFTSDAFEVFDQYMSSNNDLVYFFHTSVYSETLQPCLRFDNRNELLKKYALKPYKKTEDEMKYGDVVPWAKMFRRSLVIEKDQKYDEVPASNDVTFVSRMAYYSKKVEVCSRIVYNLTYRRGSITRVVNRTNELSRYKVCLRFNNFLKEIGCKRLRNRILSRVWIAYKNFGLREAILYIKLAYQYNQSIFTALIPSLTAIKNKIVLMRNKDAYQG